MKKLILMLFLVVGGVLSASADTKTFYLDATSISAGNAWFALYALTSDDSEAKWYTFSKVSGNFYSVSYDSKYSKLVIVRMNPSESTPSFDDGKCWNQSYNIEGAPDKAYFASKEGDDIYDGKYFKCAPYCIVDDGTITGNSWSPWTTYMIYNESNGLLEYSCEPKIIDKEGFKIRIRYGNWVYGANYGDESNSKDDNNINVSIANQGAYYKFAMTFNPATKADPEYTLTQVEPISITSPKGFGTLTSTNALDFTGTGITAYTAIDKENGNAQLVAVTNPAASTPMLLKAASEGTYYVPVAASGDTNPSENAFKAGDGNGLATEVGDYYNYILNNGEFYWANNKTVASNKAYLQLKKAGAGARISLIFPEDEVTSIEGVANVKESTGAFFNLQGVKVANPSKGLYIRNGKKFIVK